MRWPGARAQAQRLIKRPTFPEKNVDPLRDFASDGVIGSLGGPSNAPDLARFIYSSASC